MSLQKNSISAPLEAGTSILDTHNLPSHLNDALEYASRRLTRKSLHVPLIAVRRDYQTPAVAPSTFDPTAYHPPASPTMSPVAGPRLGFAASLRQRLHPILTSLSLSTPSDGCSTPRSNATSPTWSMGSEALSSGTWSKPSWPCTPMTPATPMSVPPLTPCTVSSAADTAPMSPGPNGIRLVYGDVLCPKEEQTVRAVLDKARRRFRLGTDWLPAPVHASSYSLPEGIIRRSLLQNDILFSSEGLSLYSLDRLYTFKAALSSYSRSRLPHRLEDAVDELRRLFLASGGRKVSRSDVLRSYDWLGVSETAMAEVDRMYRRAYGGPDGAGAIDGMVAPPQHVRIEYDDALDDVIHLDAHENPVLIFPSSPIETLTPILKAAPLRLQTTFETRKTPKIPREEGGEDEEDEDEELTARPERQRNVWALSIDQVLVPKPKPDLKHVPPDSGSRPGSRPGSRASRLSAKPGPVTPRAYEDISPITRGEWGFLFSDAGFGVRTAAVETC
ncbi:uncharacterized protein DNG_05467 [Cephalotrichum gorgonifer]|uniref:DUF7582 domain-containing protein n=1 Tax=Cephalotrichum gorgonifer TaxID=2041049 RepID=A0AAE8SWA6_9PEZI|nr:uncharacterized protein DNG_05467 [Cephalotrichum gorgonifer]